MAAVVSAGPSPDTPAGRGPEAGAVRRVLVTGATGFVGRAFVAHAPARGLEVVAAIRGPGAALPGRVRAVAVGDLAGPVDWPAALEGVDAVVHLAARVHVMHDASADPAGDYRRVNVDATVALARAAEAAGVRRFVFASSVKALGESTPADRPFDDATPPHPEDPYGASKLEAERALHAIGAAGRIEAVVLRPPLMIGPGVRGNLRLLARAVGAGVPLPLGAIDNRRSLLSVGNFADALALALVHPGAVGGTFLIRDGEDLSTPALVRRIARAMGRRARLWPVPVGLLRAAGAVAGRADAVARLTESLRIDDAGWRAATGWTPPLDVDAGIASMVAAGRPARGPG